MASLNHIHTYKKVKVNKSTIFRCIKTGCNHYLQKQFITGKESECPYCKEKFIIGPREVKMVYPHCDTCRERFRVKFREGIVEMAVASDLIKRDEIPRTRTAEDIINNLRKKT